MTTNLKMNLKLVLFAISLAVIVHSKNHNHKYSNTYELDRINENDIIPYFNEEGKVDSDVRYPQLFTIKFEQKTIVKKTETDDDDDDDEGDDSDKNENEDKDGKNKDNKDKDEKDEDEKDDKDEAITEDDLNKKNKTGIVESMKHHAPTVVRDLIAVYIRQKIEELRTNAKNTCEKFKEFPILVQQKFMDCGEEHLETSNKIVGRLLDNMASTKDLIKYAREGFKRCKERKDEIEAENREKEKNKNKDNEKEEKEKETSLSDSKPRTRREVMAEIALAHARPRPTTTKKPTIWKKAKEFVKFVGYQIKKYGCYITTSLGIVLNATVLVLDIVTNIYEGYDLSRVMNEKIGACMKTSFDEYLKELCKDFIPVEHDDRK